MIRSASSNATLAAQSELIVVGALPLLSAMVSHPSRAPERQSEGGEPYRREPALLGVQQVSRRADIRSGLAFRRIALRLFYAVAGT